ncbi:hypothetical protein ACFL23_02055 [Patescibacteria group bacterium]
MKTSIKNLQEISGFHDLRTYTGTVRKTGKPDLPTTAILDLYMRRNEKDRLEKELQRLRKRKRQLQSRLEEVNKEMIKLSFKATKAAEEICGKVVKEIGDNAPQKRKKLLLEY